MNDFKMFSVSDLRSFSVAHSYIRVAYRVIAPGFLIESKRNLRGVFKSPWEESARTCLHGSSLTSRCFFMLVAAAAAATMAVGCQCRGREEERKENTNERRQSWRPAVSEDRPLNHRTEFHLAFRLLSTESTTYLPVDLDLLRSDAPPPPPFSSGPSSLYRLPPRVFPSGPFLISFLIVRLHPCAVCGRPVGVLHVPRMSPALDYEYW